MSRGTPGPCVHCGSEEWVLKYRATAEGVVALEEFSCTTSALSRHDDIFDCTSCGIRSSAPTLEPEEIISRYESVVDEIYLDEELARRRTFGWILEQTEQRYAGERRLLEFGSNIGLFLRVATDRGWVASGIEPSRWSVAEGKRRFDVDLSEGTVETAQVRPGSVPVIVMLDVLEHLDDPQRALSRVAEMLEPRGVLILTTIDVSSLHSRIRGGSWPWYIRSHLHYFSPGTLTALMHSAGLEPRFWANVPRSFRADYILHKGGWRDRWWGGLVAMAFKVSNPNLPTGWLGDIKIVIADAREQ